ncbi:MAG: hypothetical protein J6C06_04015 [Lachnospiraceae bacterium]|nr:hypothetical protein [Lachnospiraceae bacterium]
MTDERLDQILKQALAPEISDAEIQIRRKVRNNNMKKKRVFIGRLAACAALALVVTGGFLGSLSSEKGDENNNLFVITAHAAELPEGAGAGEVIGLSMVEAGQGSLSHLSGRFMISGHNIEKINITTDKCELYTTVPVYEGDPDYENAQNGQEDYYVVYEGGAIAYYEYSPIVGQSYEGEYDNQMSFGMSVPKDLWSTSDDLKEGFHETVDQVNGATLTVKVTFADGSTEEHHYKLTTGKIYVPEDANGHLQYDNLTRFLTEDESKVETPYIYGYLMEKID